VGWGGVGVRGWGWRLGGHGAGRRGPPLPWQGDGGRLARRPRAGRTCRMSGSVRRWMGVGRRKPLRLIALISHGLSPIDSGGGGGGARAAGSGRARCAAARSGPRRARARAHKPCPAALREAPAPHAPNVPGFFFFCASFLAFRRRPDSGLAAASSAQPNSTTSPPGAASLSAIAAAVCRAAGRAAGGRRRGGGGGGRTAAAAAAGGSAAAPRAGRRLWARRGAGTDLARTPRLLERAGGLTGARRRGTVGAAGERGVGGGRGSQD
jgi:hypothetical protein